MVYTIKPNLINEFSWGINRGKQGVDPLDSTSADTATGGVKTYAQNLLPLKDASGNALALPTFFREPTIEPSPAGEFRLPFGHQRAVRRPKH